MYGGTTAGTGSSELFSDGSKNQLSLKEIRRKKFYVLLNNKLGHFTHQKITDLFCINFYMPSLEIIFFTVANMSCLVI